MSPDPGTTLRVCLALWYFTLSHLPVLAVNLKLGHVSAERVPLRLPIVGEPGLTVAFHLTNAVCVGFCLLQFSGAMGTSHQAFLVLSCLLTGA